MGNCTPVVALAALIVCGCATNVPRMAEFGKSDVDHYIDESNIVGHIKCELHSAVQTVLEIDTFKEDPRFSATWLNDWGAKIALKLVVEEKTALSPSFAFTNPMRNQIKTFPSGGPVTVGQNQSTSLGASIGSAATRTETIGFFYAFDDLLKERRINEPCSDGSRGLLQGDLRILQFMNAKVQHSQVPGHVLRKPKQPPYDTLTYQVSFVVTKTANLTAGWKLQYYLINPTAPLINGSRVQTHDLTLTMGPVKKDAVTGPTPSEALRDAHLAAMIGDEVARAIGARSQ